MGKAPTGGAAYRLGQALLSLLFRATGGVVVEGGARIPLHGPLIVVANHASLVDGLILVAFFPRRLHSLSAAYLFRRPVIGRFLRWFGAIPIGSESGQAVGLKKAMRLLEAGGALMVFPEGGITSKPRPFQPGWAYLALKSGAVVLPVGIQESARLLPPGRWCLRRAKVKLLLGTPLVISRVTRPRRDEIASLNAAIERQVRELAGHSRE
ncbi:MAG: Phospholipid/glycerol acyltransferase [Clostridia bacterium 62_21]|nr:MAG: Phospholipid/glycerol acyltransferase [Clostridia bacterium 62_21]